MSNFVGKIGDAIQAPVEIVHIVSRKKWKKSIAFSGARRADVRKALYILKDQTGNVYTVAIASDTAFDVGQKLKLKGTIANHSVFCDVKQNHIVCWSFELERR